MAGEIHSENLVRKEFVVTNSLGIHARPAADFVQTAKRFRSSIRIVKDDGEGFAADRILDLLRADLSQGTRFTLEVEGSDAREAADSFVELMKTLSRDGA